jgi:hypothetical protein
MTDCYLREVQSRATAASPRFQAARGKNSGDWDSVPKKSKRKYHSDRRRLEYLIDNCVSFNETRGKDPLLFFFGDALLARLGLGGIAK